MEVAAQMRPGPKLLQKLERGRAADVHGPSPAAAGRKSPWNLRMPLLRRMVQRREERAIVHRRSSAPRTLEKSRVSTLALAALIQAPAARRNCRPAPATTREIPTLEEVAGHGFRDVVTPPDDVIRYMEALAAAAPERTRLIRYAESWEGRPSSSSSSGRRNAWPGSKP